jgi:nicotinate-nucleotide pyrophosphorylase (carboxylating)
MFELPDSDALIASALAEDLGVPAARFLPGPRPAGDDEAPLLDHDVTSASTVPADAWFEGVVRAREACVVCGLPVLARAFELLAQAAGGEPVEVFPLVAEGASIAADTAIAEVSGPARTVLAGERTALDFMMTLSGIATTARAWQEAAGPDLAVCDTRKTWPGLRALSKYAVRVGGATNHRAGLWDMVLVKDNHLAEAGGIAQAVEGAKALHPDLPVEVEADTVEQAVEAVSAGADLVLLDNMEDATLAAAVAAVRQAAGERGRACLTEASGGVALDRLPALAALGVDRVSSSALTMTRPVDIGLDEA